MGSCRSNKKKRNGSDIIYLGVEKVENLVEGNMESNEASHVVVVKKKKRSRRHRKDRVVGETPPFLSWRSLEQDFLLGNSASGKGHDQTNAKPLEDGDSEVIKGGRHCDLCWGGTDGKPPKKLVRDNHSGASTSSEEPKYELMDEFGDKPGWLGRLLGPIKDSNGVSGTFVHEECIVWTPEVYYSIGGNLKSVKEAISRGRALKCIRCRRPGATISCRVKSCQKTYHLPCARDCRVLFDHRKFLIACEDHRHQFKPHGNKYTQHLRKLKKEKMKMDLRKISDEALRKDQEAEEKWLENYGEDEEFLKWKSKKLQKDLLRIAPVYIGGVNSDSGMQFEGWESVAGLQDVIRCLKEVVTIPLLYPEFFSNSGLTPPGGILLHGHPGTGKTLVMRALIGSCSRGDKKIAYFARKGADCLGKYVGDSERQLRLLFEAAERSQPSIIFFDEIDGLAPCRTRQQDQTHSSVVSTLLSLMDGLKSRGSVVVIGATNRPEAIDPALRRPGRFDREVYFPLPSVKDREAILTLQTQKWPKPINGSLLKWVAKRTVGFASADLQALCTQAAIVALCRNFPLQEILSSSGQNASLSKRPPLSYFTVEERDWLYVISSAPLPCSRREPGIAANDMVSSPLPSHLVPCLLQPLTKLLVSLYLDDLIWLPPPLSKAATLIKTVISSALDKKKMQCENWWSSIDDLLQDTDILVEIENNLSRATILTEDANGHLNTLKDFVGDDYLMFKPSRSHTFVDEWGKVPGFRTLISGEPRCGQRHLASCLLHCFVGNVENRKLDLATMFQEGHGDEVQGLTKILMGCNKKHPCIIFLPRIDLWAVETKNQEQSDSPSSRCTEDGDSTEISETKDAVKTASYLWNLFIRQIESTSGCTSLMILATSEVPLEDIPCRISQFFGSEMSNNSFPRTLKDAVPRFVVEVDGNLNRNMAIEASAAKLSKDLVQYFIHLVHLGNHNQSNSLGEKKTLESFEGNIDTSNQNLHRESAASHANKYPLNAKPNSAIAISTFSCQILQYPDFADLCWFTSKLKEGPYTRIDGPWKKWPFNSCIVSAANAPERVKVTSGFSVPKNKEKPYLVRGLVAIGLSAYRGEYTSIRQVSLEVRKVLKLLVELVNDKIQAGKDRYKFFHLLSQVAYFDDMVTSWAYTLRSFDVDAQVLEGRPTQIDIESLNRGTIYKDGLPKVGNECKKNISNNTLQDSVRTDAKITANGDLSSPNKGDAVEGTSRQVLLESSTGNHAVMICCCSYCAANLRELLLKILRYKWELKGCNLTVEDFHDLVSSLSSSFQSAVRKMFETESLSHGCDEQLSKSKRSKSSGKRLKAIECGYHSKGQRVTKEESRHGYDLNFNYRDGVLSRVEADQDVPLQCKFEKFCLCFLVNCIVMSSKESLDSDHSINPHLLRCSATVLSHSRKRASWGVLVQPDRPYTLQLDAGKERLRISQTTLGGEGIEEMWSRLECVVGSKVAKPICSLTSKKPCISLELEFEESEDVVFYVKGPVGIHLAGYYVSGYSTETSDDP